MNAVELLQLLPGCTIRDDPVSLHQVNTATFQTQTRSRLIVQPRSTADVVMVVQFAGRQHATIYPISRGKNWGFGSKVPVADCDILLDLSCMNRILSYDAEFGTVRCEPGVTFQQLSNYLRDQGNRHFVSAIGGDPQASVLGNVLERGDGAGPYCERAKYVSSLEVVLADGSVIVTGYGNIQNSQLADVVETGVGPAFQELFFQSNYGIVTAITLWLRPMPAFFRTFSFSQNEAHSLPDLLNTLRDLYRRRVLHDPITFWNDYKQVATAMHAPFRLSAGQMPLARNLIKQHSNNYSTWYAFGGAFVDDAAIGQRIVRELFKRIRPHIRPQNRWSHLSTRKIAWLRRFNRLAGLTGLKLDALLEQWEHSPLLGQAGQTNLHSLFWRKQRAAPAGIDPDRQLCGVLWNAFIMPFDGAAVARVIEEIEAIVFRYQFEPILSFVVLNDRYIRVFQQLLFDREDLVQDQAALACHQTVFDYLEAAGYSHARLDILHMDRKLLISTLLNDKIKGALDPQGIIAPGRYFT
jgi:4-cresol dehydrogenase (hydroxylating)